MNGGGGKGGGGKPADPIPMQVTFPATVREGGPENQLLGDGQLPTYDHAICGVRAVLGDEGDGQVGMNFQAFDNVLSFGKKGSLWDMPLSVTITKQ